MGAGVQTREISNQSDMSELTTGEIFDAYAPFVLRMVRRLGVSESDREDVAQEVFIVIHRKLGQFDHTCSLKTWIFAITRRVVAGYKRKAHFRKEVVSKTTPEGATSPEEAETSSQMDLLRQSLDRLSEKQRSVFILYELEGLSMNEVSKAVGCPLFTAHTRLRTARKKILAFYKQVENGGRRGK